MTTPTREQVIAAPIESYSAEDRAFYAFWYAHMKDNMMQPPLNTVHHAVARMIYTAGRDQGLREAVEAVRSKTHHPDDPNNCVWTAAYDHVASEHAAAIEQLRGK